MCSCSDTDINPKYQMCKDRFDQWPPHEYNSSNIIRYFNYLVPGFLFLPSQGLLERVWAKVQIVTFFCLLILNYSLPSVASSSLRNANWNGDKMDDLPKQIVKPSGIDPFIRLVSLKFKYRTRKRKGT